MNGDAGAGVGPPSGGNGLVVSMYPKRLLDDLARSGLSPNDVRPRLLGEAEKAVTGAPQGCDGYVLPYFDINGRPVPFYRARIYTDAAAISSGQVDSGEAKYRQVVASPNYIYYPPKFRALLEEQLAQTTARTDSAAPTSGMGQTVVEAVDGVEIRAAKGGVPYILITEGEKKAAASVNAGILCVGLSGVDSWRNRNISLPKDTKLTSSGSSGGIQARLPGGGGPYEGASTLATGLQDLIDLVLRLQCPLILVFDTDGPQEKEPIARAKAQLAFELRHKGVPVGQIRGEQLPLLEGALKTGLDDFLIHPQGGPVALKGLLARNLTRNNTFPRYPNIRAYISGKLARTNITRQEREAVAFAIISDLDARGHRLLAPDSQAFYYFSDETRRLIQVNFPNGGKGSSEFASSEFGSRLYREYGVTYGDTAIIPYLATQFASEAPLQEVYPEKVSAWRGDTLYYQLNDGQSIRISRAGMHIINNGDDGVLFESGMVEPISELEFRKAFNRAKLEAPLQQALPNHWYSVLQEARVKPSAEDRQRLLLSLLYYVSPLFYRWRDTQLPVEMTLGEAGSGKTSLYVVRSLILTGIPNLRNVPNDIKDWNAGLANTGGLHITDNVQFADSNLRQKLSDEIAQPLDALVLTPLGWRQMGDLEVGDLVITPSGSQSKIVQTHPRGPKEVFRIEFTDGASTECCAGHLWARRTESQRVYGSKYQVNTLYEIMSRPLKGKLPGRYANYIPVVNPQTDLTQSNSAPLQIDPYLLGALLGDGCFRMNQPDFAANEEFIANKVEQRLPEGNTFRQRQPGVYTIGGTTNPLRERLKALNLWGCDSHSKFIPEEYLFTSWENRLELLQGLMDTDETVNQSHSAFFNSVSLRLAKGVQFLVQSLGGTGSISKASNGSYTVSARIAPDLCPSSLPRKVAGYWEGKTKGQCTRAIRSITPIGEKDVKCITIDSPDQLYVTNDFIVTHNCRLITEPKATIEQRKLYSDSTLVRIRVKSVFAVTAIKQPFTNVDIVQRAIITDLDKGISSDLQYDGEWTTHQVSRFGGRPFWLAHHMLFVYRFLRLALGVPESPKEASTVGKWQGRYKARYRLINLEQILLLSGEVLGIPPDWIPPYLESARDSRLNEADWAMEGLQYWADSVREQHISNLAQLEKQAFTAGEIAQFFETESEFQKCFVLQEARQLGRYLTSNKHMIASTIGLYPDGLKGNKSIYRLKGKP